MPTDKQTALNSIASAFGTSSAEAAEHSPEGGYCAHCGNQKKKPKGETLGSKIGYPGANAEADKE